jgi:hypothetical protein
LISTKAPPPWIVSEWFPVLGNVVKATATGIVPTPGWITISTSSVAAATAASMNA